jgi:hypothetical protein
VAVDVAAVQTASRRASQSRIARTAQRPQGHL